MIKSITLTKPTMAHKSKLEAAVLFAESGIATKNESSEQRVFFAPKGHRRLTINLPEVLHKKLKYAAVDQNCTATAIIERLLIKEFMNS